MSTTHLTLRTAFEQYYLLHAYDLNERSRKKIRHELNRWERYSRDRPVDQLETIDFVEFRQACLAAGLSARTIEGTVASLLSILRHLGPPSDVAPHGIGLIPRVPYVGRRLSRPRPVPVVPSVEDLGAMYDAAGVAKWPGLDMPPALFWQCWIVISYFTALRLSDLMQALTWDCWDRNAGVLTIRAGKTGWSHLIPLHWVATAHLEALWNAPRLSGLDAGSQREERIFPVSKSPHLIRREMRAMCQEAGVRTITPHQIRKAAITELTVLHETAGKLLHGCSLGVMDHYTGLKVLKTHIPNMPYPATWETGISTRDAA